MTDRAGTVLYRNELARAILGLDHDVIGRTDWLASVETVAAAELDRVLVRAREERQRDTLVVAIERAGAGPMWVRVDAVPQVDEEGRSFGVIATLLDVTSETNARKALAETQDRLWQLATHDPLTNLANRVLFLERLTSALDQADDGGLPVALLYGDLDGFKPVNDAHGHTVGDLVLQVVAARLSTLAREDDVVCRFGGDEFVVLCEGFASVDDVHALAERLAASVAAPIDVGGEHLDVGITFGVAFAEPGMRVDELITAADGAMYAKKHQRNA